jgi:RNA polymerase sigma-70 factor (ECF subfamily)
MTDQTDAEFEGFVREYQDMVYATAVRLLGRPADAEDVAQTVFLKAFEHFDGLAGNPSVPGWLKTVTLRLCFNHLARYRRRWRFFSEEAGADRTASPDERADEALQRTDRDAALERAIRRLPDAQRVPLVLFHFEGQSYQEIAGALGVSLGKIKTDIHRARQALRKELSSDAGFR